MANNMKIYKLKIKFSAAIFVAEDKMQVLCLIAKNNIFEGLTSKDILPHLVEIEDETVTGEAKIIAYYEF